MEQNHLDKQLEAFRSVIIAEALEEREKNARAAAAAHKQNARDAKELALATSSEKVRRQTAAIRNKVNRALTDKRFQAKKVLLRRRTEIQNEVMDAVTARIESYTASPDYIPELAAQLKGINLAMLSDKIIVFLPKKEQGEKELVERYLPHAAFETDETIRFGGFKIKDRKKQILLDFTIDGNITQAFDRFLEISGLSAEI